MEKQRKLHLEMIRIIAVFLVIFNHTDGFIYYIETTNRLTWLFSLGMAGICRIAVPLFFMVSGALLLDREESVKDLFQNAYVMESDLVLYNPNIIRKYEYHSNFLGKKVDVTDDWCFDVKNGIIVKEKVRPLDTHIINLAETGNLLPEGRVQKLQGLGAEPVMGICCGHALHLVKGICCYSTSFFHG